MPERKSIMRSLGEFVGHIGRAVKEDPRSASADRKQTIRQSTEVERRGPVTLRRTTIEEIEFRDERDLRKDH